MLPARVRWHNDVRPTNGTQNAHTPAHTARRVQREREVQLRTAGRLDGLILDVVNTHDVLQIASECHQSRTYRGCLCTNAECWSSQISINTVLCLVSKCLPTAKNENSASLSATTFLLGFLPARVKAIACWLCRRCSRVLGPRLECNTSNRGRSGGSSIPPHSRATTCCSSSPQREQLPMTRSAESEPG